MNPVLIPIAGLVMLFSGFSTLGFAFTAVDTGTSNTGTNAIVYYTFNALGILTAIVGAAPVLFKIGKREVECALACAGLASVFFVVAIIFGVIENYKVSTAAVSNGSALYFMNWITAACSMIANGGFASLALIALYPPPKCTDDAPNLCPELEEVNVETTSKTKKVPKSRSTMISR